MAMMTELVKRLVLSNEVRGEIVYCPECSESIKAEERKTVASKYVRHDACHLAWRHTQGYQGDPVAKQQANQQVQ